jgi:hypothetical protein
VVDADQGDECGLANPQATDDLRRGDHVMR